MTQIIVFIIFGGLGAMFLVVGVRELLTQRRLLASAIPVEAEIVHAGISRSRSADTDRSPMRSTSTTSYTSDIRFRYVSGGATHESERLRPTMIVRGHASHESAAREIAAFPVGARVTAYVDPREPDKAFLLREKSAAPAVFLALGIVLPPLAWFVGGLI